MTNKRGTIHAQITARERLRRTRLRLARAPPDVLRGTVGQTVLLTLTLLRSRPIGSCSVRRTPTPWPGMDPPLVIPRGNGPPACPHNASRRAFHLCKRRDPRLRAASAPRPCSPLLAHIPALLALACAHAVESSTHVLCQASGTMRATSLALCDMPYDPSLAAQPSAPAANLRAPLKADESWRSVVTTDHVPLLILPTTTRDTHWHPPSPNHPYTSTGTF